MELTLDQALQKGIEAHKAGNVQEADRYYTAILNANSKHPDANHNMGVLAVGVGKFEEALPFFKTALKVNSSIAQYWLSYIDALIKLDRFGEAGAVLEQAKSKGVRGNEFDQVEKRLRSTPSKNPNTQEPSQEELNALTQLYNQNKVEQVLKEAQKLTKIYSKSLILWNLVGASAAQIGQLEEAVIAFKKAISIKPDYAHSHNSLGNALQDQGKLEEAVEAYKKALCIEANYAAAFNNLGTALKDQAKLEEALAAFKKALSIKPDYAEAHNNIGNALQKQGKLEEAIEAYKKALSIKPDYADAYYNMGITLKDQGKLDEAIKSYKTAISIKPYYAEVYNNIGTALQKQGKLEKALTAFKKALSIKPDYAEAHNNMGAALQRKGKLDGAIKAYKKALSIKPDYAEAFWNLSGTATDIAGSKNWLKKCLKADPNYFEARLTLSALKFYEGDKSKFNELIKSPLKDHPYMRSFAWIFNLPNLPPLHFYRWALFDHMIEQSKKNRPFYEFGVWRGEAFRHLIKSFKKGYGFDTFEGLPEDWHNEKAGTYTSDGNIPKIKGGKFIVGKFEDTLPSFFAVERPMASIINFDADLYSSTICALNFAKPVIDQHTILIFDEFLINDNWEQDEYKALEEFCSNNGYTYEVLAISFFTKQVAVKLIGI